jgi:hypothetical protein
LTILAVVIVALAAVVVFVIAAVTVGREARRLDAVAPRTVYVLDDAVDYVADRVPPQTQARVTHDEVRLLLRLHMGELRAKGLVPPGVVDHEQDIVEPVVLEETGDAGHLMGRADAADIEVGDVDIIHIVDAHFAYLDAIGAVGPPAEPDLG